MKDNRRSIDDPLVTLLPEDVISLDWAKRIGLVLFSVHRTDSKTRRKFLVVSARLSRRCLSFAAPSVIAKRGIAWTNVCDQLLHSY